MRHEDRRKRIQLRDQLFQLAQLDTNAVCLYDEALKHVVDEDLQHTFERFRGEHRQHVSELPFVIQHIGWATPEFKVDLKGHLEDWLTSLRCATGTTGVLHAMWILEKHHNKLYCDATGWDVDDPALVTLLSRFHEHESGHLTFMERRLGEAASSATAHPQL